MAHGPTLLGLLALTAASALALSATREDSPGAPATRATAPPGLTFADWPPSAAASRGRLVYERNCIGCHGDAGRGDGPAARWLSPLPRDFQEGRFKFRTTPSGELPTVDDIRHVVHCGLAGSSMPGFPLMQEQHKRDVAEYVLYLATFGLLAAEVDYELGRGATLDEVLGDDWQDLQDEVLGDAFEEVWPVDVPAGDESSDESIARGRELYAAQCVACHGAGGRGDGPSSYALRDWKDAEVLPRDFTTGVYRAGSTPRDLFLRMRTGLNGTPMPEISGSDDDLWALVHFMQSLRDPDTREKPHPTSCAAHDRQVAR